MLDVTFPDLAVIPGSLEVFIPHYMFQRWHGSCYQTRLNVIVIYDLQTGEQSILDQTVVQD